MNWIIWLVIGIAVVWGTKEGLYNLVYRATKDALEDFHVNDVELEMLKNSKKKEE